MTLRDVNAALARRGPVAADRQRVRRGDDRRHRGDQRCRAARGIGTARRATVIGITLAMTDGRLVKAGGTVVKNVAGYDLGKLVSGSYGTLAAIVDVTFKLVADSRSVGARSCGLLPDARAAGRRRGCSGRESARARGVRRPRRRTGRGARFSCSCGSRPARRRRRRADRRGAARSCPAQATIADRRGRDATSGREQVDAAGRAVTPTVRLSWLPRGLPQVLALLDELQRSDGCPRAVYRPRLGAGAVRLSGGMTALVAAVERLRAERRRRQRRRAARIARAEDARGRLGRRARRPCASRRRIKADARSGRHPERRPGADLSIRRTRDPTFADRSTRS